jgi:hypothetical protein
MQPFGISGLRANGLLTNWVTAVFRFMSDWVDLRKHNRRRRMVDVEDCASEKRAKSA